MVTTRSTDARTSADEASVPEEHLETPRPTESDAEEEVAVDDNSSNGEPSTKSFRPNSNDSSEESLEDGEPTPPPKCRPTAKAKPAARSRSRNTSKPKKFNVFDKPAPFVPPSRPAAPSHGHQSRCTPTTLYAEFNKVSDTTTSTAGRIVSVKTRMGVLYCRRVNLWVGGLTMVTNTRRILLSRRLF